MEKYIGNIKLNFDFYKGNDLYSDGVVEDELLDIVKNYSEYEDIIKERKEWPIIYHLSKIRENIIEWIPINKTDNVLEVGSGCGAITGILSKKAKQVDCIELSQKRSYINAYRNKSKSNINIFVGNFEDIEKNMTEKYDYITLIGVFEYAESYINSKKPYIEFLRIVKKHLKKNGKIIIAIENRLGLKYWAGCKEDHLGTYFEGLEGYREDKGIKTFSKNELEDIFKLVGFYKYNFYYPYPDYKLPITIYSDEYLPKLGELNNNFRNFDLDRVVTFNETEVFDSII
ncbi:class I SAM-dependent methyltransferase, partial [Clostridioides difficile]